MKRAASSILLALAYLTVVGAWTIADVVTGLLFGLAVVWGTGTEFARVPGMVRGLPRLALGTAGQIARGSWKMLRVLLGIDPWRHVGVVEVPVGERSPEGILVTEMVMSISPSSVFVTTDETKGTLVFTVIDASRPEVVRTSIDDFYHRSQKKAVP